MPGAIPAIYWPLIWPLLLLLPCWSEFPPLSFCPFVRTTSGAISTPPLSSSSCVKLTLTNQYATTPGDRVYLCSGPTFRVSLQSLTHSVSVGSPWPGTPINLQHFSKLGTRLGLFFFSSTVDFKPCFSEKTVLSAEICCFWTDIIAEEEVFILHLRFGILFLLLWYVVC